MQNTWICIGGSPSAPEMFQRARADYPGATVITSNSGIKLCLPEFYFLHDIVACEKFSEAAKVAQCFGTKVITLQRKPLSIAKRGLEFADIFLPFISTGDILHFRRGEINSAAYSGMYCVQYAIQRGVDRLAVVGHEGYAVGDNHPYWDTDWQGGPVDTSGQETKNIIGPWWRNCVSICQDIEFVFYGDLNYAVDGPNVSRRF